MIIEIVPDYDMFVKVLFALFVIKGITNFITGIAQTELNSRKNAGWVEVIAGVVILLIVLWLIM